MLDELKATFAVVNGWLQFAETKHGVLIGLNGAALLSLSPQVCQLANSPWLFWWGVGGIAAVLISTLISLFSFLPRLSRPPRIGASQQSGENLVYFRDLASFTASDLVHRYAEALHTDASQSGSLEHHYAAQIVANSGIGYLKYRMFAVSVWFDLLALIPPLALVWALVRSLKARKR